MGGKEWAVGDGRRAVDNGWWGRCGKEWARRYRMGSGVGFECIIFFVGIATDMFLFLKERHWMRRTTMNSAKFLLPLNYEKIYCLERHMSLKI